MTSRLRTIPGYFLYLDYRPMAYDKSSDSQEITGEDIKNFREELGLSQADLALRLKLNVMTISRWERGTRSIRQPEVIRRALDTVRDDLLKAKAGRRGRPPKKSRDED